MDPSVGTRGSKAAEVVHMLEYWYLAETRCRKDFFTPTMAAGKPCRLI